MTKAKTEEHTPLMRQYSRVLQNSIISRAISLIQLNAPDTEACCRPIWLLPGYRFHALLPVF